MFNKISAHLDGLFARLNARECAEAATYFAQPAALVCPEDQRLMPSHAESSKFLRDFVETGQMARFRVFKNEVVSVSLTERLRTRARVRLLADVEGAEEPYVMESDFTFLDVGGGALRIELISCPVPRLATLVAESETLRRSA